MHARGLSLWFCILLALTLSAIAPADASFVPGEVLVQVQPGTDMARFNTEYGTRVREQWPGTLIFRLQIPPAVDPEALTAVLRLDPRVVWAEPNFIVRTPESNGVQWTSTFDGGTSADGFHQQPATGQVRFKESGRISDGSGVTVAILDTGISVRHGYLRGKVISGWNTLDENAQTDDAPDGRDNNGNGGIDEQTGHGTMVAGIVALLAHKARLLPMKVLDSDGTGNVWDLAQGIRLSWERGAKVLNLSLTVTRRSILLELALEEAYARGVVVVASAGNNNSDQPQYPAAVPKVLAVAALNPDDTKARFSNYGRTIDVCAPGVEIYSINWNGRFGIGSGTSFAAPFVTAEVALVWSLSLGMRNSAAQDLVCDTARSVDAVNPHYRGNLGRGAIEIDKALQRLSKR